MIIIDVYAENDGSFVIICTKEDGGFFGRVVNTIEAVGSYIDLIKEDYDYVAYYHKE